VEKNLTSVSLGLLEHGLDGPPGPGGPFSPTGRLKGRPNRATREALALLAEATPDLAARLIKLAEPIRPGAVCTVCGAGMERPEDFQLKAITTVLDRAGAGPHQKIEVEQKADTSFVNYLTEEELATIDEIYERAAQRQAQDQPVKPYAEPGSASD